MSLTALTHADNGTPRVPDADDDWSDWVSAGRTRNHVLGDPLLDWLERYGEEHGFARDTQLAGYDVRTDFTEFLFRQGRLFEEAVVRHLRTLIPVLTISTGPEDIRDLAKAEETFAAMRVGVPAIHQGVVRDAEHGTYGAPDLLVRADVLATLFPGALTADEIGSAAPDLDGPWHYRVVDVKFSTLHLSAGGTVGNSGSAPAYKTQLFIYNRALGRLQGITPPEAYLVGRGWEQTLRGETLRGANCVERLGPVPMDGALTRDVAIHAAADAACRWIRRVRREGRGWQLLPEPVLPELYPDMTNNEDGPWHAAKRRIAEALEELTLLWQVGAAGRRGAHDAGVYRWRDPACTPAVVGVTGEKRPGTLQAILDVNRALERPPVQPAHVQTAEAEWRPVPPLEFYIDFETVSDLDDDFARVPAKGGQPLIFMIGCGHIEDGRWRFECFVADDLTEPSEEAILDAWFDYMAAVRARCGTTEQPRAICWSHAENSWLETQYNSATARHPGRTWPPVCWFDFLQRVMREEPVVIRGAMGFGLKAVAKSLHGLGLVETSWSDGPTDGLGAMVGAWWAYVEAARVGRPVRELDLMREIIAYNEVDCRVMWEVARYLREHH